MGTYATHVSHKPETQLQRELSQGSSFTSASWGWEVAPPDCPGTGIGANPGGVGSSS